LFDLLLAAAGGVQIGWRRFLRLLHEGVEQDHAPFGDAKNHAGDAAVREVAAHLPKPAAQWPAQRHAHRPAKFDDSNVEPDDAVIRFRQGFQPLPDRFDAAG